MAGNKKYTFGTLFSTVSFTNNYSISDHSKYAKVFPVDEFMRTNANRIKNLIRKINDYKCLRNDWRERVVEFRTFCAELRLGKQNVSAPS